MVVWTPRFAWAMLLAALLTTTGFGQPRLFTIPLGADPAAFASGTTEMEAPAGGRVCVEFRLSGEPTELFAANLLIQEPFGWPDNGLLIVEDSPKIDRTHPDFVGNFFPSSPLVVQQNCCCAAACQCPPDGGCDADFRVGYLIAALAPEDFATVPETAVYLGQHCYQAGPQLGSFVVEWLEPELSTKLVAPGETEPMLGVVYDPHVVHVVECTERAQCLIDDPCAREACVEGVCTYTDVAYGDVDGNGVRNLFDIICIIKGMGGEFERCTFEDADIEPCGGNGLLDDFDVMAAAEATIGVDPCCR